MTYDEWKARNPADEEEDPAETARREHEENPCPPESGCEACWPEPEPADEWDEKGKDEWKREQP